MEFPGLHRQVPQGLFLLSREIHFLEMAAHGAASWSCAGVTSPAGSRPWCRRWSASDQPAYGSCRGMEFPGLHRQVPQGLLVLSQEIHFLGRAFGTEPGNCLAGHGAASWSRARVTSPPGSRPWCRRSSASDQPAYGSCRGMEFPGLHRQVPQGLLVLSQEIHFLAMAAVETLT